MSPFKALRRLLRAAADFREVRQLDKDTPIIQLKGVGEKTQKMFEKLEIRTVGELLAHYPRDYETFEEPVKISRAVPGELCAVCAAVTGIPSEKKIRNLSILNVDLSDDTGSIQLTFYLLPRYSLTKGLTNQAVQKAMRQALDSCGFEDECYEEAFLARYELLPEKTALENVHFPGDDAAFQAARRRLAFDEFFSFLFFMKKNKAFSEKLPNHYPMMETADTVRFLEQLPFPLTGAQKKVWDELRRDLGSPYCMNRLIQGDVGSGKTILALLALLMTAANGYQGALMAPTEVLAAQHYETVQGYVKKYDLVFRPVLLVGSMKASEKREAYDQIASGAANLVIGTHALIQDKVKYRSLALVVTDEQHRFGVRQRERLADKGVQPHICVMSATPIPRKNCVVNTSYRPSAYRFIAAEASKGRQIYVICPQVEEGELEELENVVDYTEKLRSVLPPQLRIAYLHGKMRAADKNRIMEEFAAHAIDVLVSTTVIEVGINVPNATVMMVENAERFGLAQLHQLRGRVGRGTHQSYCIFVSTQEKKETMERLQILNQSNNGFFIASQDLKLRGPGELMGVRQSGAFSFRTGDIYTDAGLLGQALEAVEELLEEDPVLEKPKHALLRKRLSDSASNSVDFRTI